LYYGNLLGYIPHFITSWEFYLSFGFFMNNSPNPFGAKIYVFVFNFVSSLGLAFKIQGRDDFPHKGYSAPLNLDTFQDV
jgi:hypothetical protein